MAVAPVALATCVHPLCTHHAPIAPRLRTQGAGASLIRPLCYRNAFADANRPSPERPLVTSVHERQPRYLDFLAPCRRIKEGQRRSLYRARLPPPWHTHLNAIPATRKTRRPWLTLLPITDDRRGGWRLIIRLLFLFGDAVTAWAWSTRLQHLTARTTRHPFEHATRPLFLFGDRLGFVVPTFMGSEALRIHHREGRKPALPVGNPYYSGRDLPLTVCAWPTTGQVT
jgi:hypothetical protein